MLLKEKKKLTKKEKLSRQRKYMKKWRKKNKAYLKGYFQEYYKKHGEKQIEAVARYMKTKKGKQTTLRYEHSTKRRRMKTLWMREFRATKRSKGKS
jgi:hypothetical protein